MSVDTHITTPENATAESPSSPTDDGLGSPQRVAKPAVIDTTHPLFPTLSPKKQRLVAQFPSDHIYREDTGKLLLSKDAHVKLGNSEIVRDLQRGMNDFSSMWERSFSQYALTQAGNNTWKWSSTALSVNPDTNGLQHVKNLWYRFYAAQTTSPVTRLCRFRWIRYPTDLIPAGLTPTVVLAVGDDYSRNIRDRAYPSNGVAGQLLGETRFSGLRLKPDEKLDVWWNNNGAVKMMIAVSFDVRTIEKGGF